MNKKGLYILILTLLLFTGLILIYSYLTKHNITTNKEIPPPGTSLPSLSALPDTNRNLLPDNPEHKINNESSVAEYYDPGYRSSFRRLRSIEPNTSEIAERHFYKHPESGIDQDIEFGLPPADSYFRFYFDNDIFCNTDYYYTNGVGFELIHPYLEVLPTARVLLPSLNYSTSYFGVGFTQHIFTPIDPDKTAIQYGDHPFAGYLYISFSKNSMNYTNRISLRSELDLGVIGPASMGSAVQSTMHEIHPVGWQNQVQNDIIINYNAGVSKSILHPKAFDLSLKGDIRTGTLYSDISAGIRIAVGNHFPEYYSVSFIEPGNKHHNKFGWQLAFTFNERYVVYNATLQGGMLNQSSIYTLHSSEINHLVFNANAALKASYGRFGIYLEQNFLAPEFRGSKRHLWGRIMLDFKL